MCVFPEGSDGQTPSNHPRISPWKSPCTSKLNDSTLGGTYAHWEENALPWWVPPAVSTVNVLTVQTHWELVALCFIFFLFPPNKFYSHKLKVIRFLLFNYTVSIHDSCGSVVKIQTPRKQTIAVLICNNNNALFSILLTIPVYEHEFTACSSLVLEEVEKQSTCELEVDAVAVDILNRLDIESKFQLLLRHCDRGELLWSDIFCWVTCA